MINAPADRSILFIENREKTRLWEGVAVRLQDRGWDVHWIVQNPCFKPSTGTLHELRNLRLGNELSESDIASLFPLLTHERGRKYFASGCAHYLPAFEEITALIQQVRPTAVVGEPTLFHELLAVQACSDLGVPYLHPAGERYLSDRFTVLSGATQTPIMKTRHRLARDEAMKISRNIATRTRRPLYMKKLTRLSAFQRRARWLWTRAAIWYGRQIGEQFNTPSALTKHRLERGGRSLRGRWAKLSTTTGLEGAILYPLQMQPEANIDVWGHPFSDQTEMVRRLAEAAPSRTRIAVKANPKWKYEVDDDLMQLIANNPQVIAIPEDMTMADVQARVLGAVTVSGTIGLEALFGLGSCISLRHPLLTEKFPSFAAGDPAEAVRKLLRNPASACGNEWLGADYLQHQYEHSFPGHLLDPFNWPFVLGEDNLTRIATGVEVVLGQIYGADGEDGAQARLAMRPEQS